MSERDHFSVGIQQMVPIQYAIPRERNHDQLHVFVALKSLECGEIVGSECIQIFRRETTQFRQTSKLNLVEKLRISCLMRKNSKCVCVINYTSGTWNIKSLPYAFLLDCIPYSYPIYRILLKEMH